MDASHTRRSFLLTGAAVAGYAAGSDAIHVGLIGCGGRGTEAAGQALSADKGARLVAMSDVLLDRVQERRTALKLKFPEQVAVDDNHCFAGFDGYQHVIESSDVVVIANAAKFHPLHMMTAIRAGKHVFVEKPHAIDPAGIQMVKAACDLARQKNLSVQSGLQSRWWAGFRETVARVHDGAIGDVVSMQENFLRAPYGLHPRKPGITEVEYQGSNQYHFHWLSGDDVPQSLVHNLDRSSWVLRNQAPLKCWGMGGRSTLKGEIYGSVFDHHAVVYEFPGGVRVYAFCRTIPGCYNETSSIILGTKGRCFLSQLRIDGETKWVYPGAKMYADPSMNPYQVEHNELFKSIRAGKATNAGDYMARSTLIGIMGQLSCYTGKEVTWEQAVNSDFYYAPRPEDVHKDTEPPVKPGTDGTYPVFTPGETKLL